MKHAGRFRAGSIRGFTLIELMIVVTVVGILVGIALPSYFDSVRKGRRGQAKSDLVELAQRAERFRTINNTYAGFYDTLSDDDQKSPRQGTDTHYAIEEVADADQNSFELRAVPQGGQESDTRCGTLTINQAGVKTESGTGDVTECW
ncbi:MAG: type IV pilin protein [Pseudomonadota bacterium]|nr:type IV pilin protein [Pseudomonadota bacterium]